MQRDMNIFGVAGKRFIRAVVNDFLKNMQRILSARVHARPLSHWLESL
jgi:hypothetical protein